ncbi:MAG: DUF952 domain-containing protein [Anaerolineaceae bacterium]|nr:DUF952 domain-containing protein [Anaerolineaceae bacterium]
MPIYHITQKNIWNNTQKDGAYYPESLDTEGFIHCSQRDQIIGSASRYFSGQSGLVLLCIESSLVRAEIRFENLMGGEQLYPHIYGPLNLDAVLKVSDFEADSQGIFHLPEETH